MANRVTVSLHNQEYRILAEEDEGYIQQCADLVNQELDRAMAGTTLSLAEGAMLTCLNIADKYSKERRVSDNLRTQLKQALDENARLAREIAEKKREIKKEKAARADSKQGDR